MANLKSAKKRVKQTEKRRLVNVARKTAIKTAVRKVLDSIDRGDAVEETTKLMRDAESKIERAKSKGVLHRNTAARKIGKLARTVSRAQKEATAK